ncbi:hypothetical protein DFQ26_004360 [Actinomortierella ambigua]|nr:hypothetical protein DFQ26_004360 [Actinomortierella ambigua]
MTVQSTKESSFKYWQVAIIVAMGPIAYTRLIIYAHAALLQSTIRWILGKTPKGVSLLSSCAIGLLRLCMGVRFVSIHQGRNMLTLCNFVVALRYGVATEKRRAQWAHPVAAPGWKGYWIPYREAKVQGPIRKAGVEDIGSHCDIVMFFIHGGGMVMGDARMWLPNCMAWIKLLREKYNIKIGILSVEYTLSPEARWPTALDECVAAYRFLVERQGIDPRRIIMSGDSAGATLCLTTALKVRDNHPGVPLPAGQILYSPWVMCHQPMKDEENDYITTEGGMAFSDAYTQGIANVRTNPYASPISAPSVAGLPKTLIYIGGAESLRPSIERFVKKAEADGVDVTVELKEGQAHDYALIEEISSRKILDEADLVMAKFVAKIRADYISSIPCPTFMADTSHVARAIIMLIALSSVLLMVVEGAVVDSRHVDVDRTRASQSKANTAGSEHDNHNVENVVVHVDAWIPLPPIPESM